MQRQRFCRPFRQNAREPGGERGQIRQQRDARARPCQLRQQKGDWRPILIILTDGKPTDLLAYSEAIPVIKSLGFGNTSPAPPGRRRTPPI